MSNDALHVERLKQALDALAKWRADASSTDESPGFGDWRDRVRDSLGQLLPERPYATRFAALVFRDFTPVTAFVPSAERAMFPPLSQRFSQSHPRSPGHRRRVFEKDLTTAESLIHEALEEHEHTSQAGAPSKPAESSGANNEGDNRKVAVVHGRNAYARDGVFQFLRALDLAPVEWTEALGKTGSAASYAGEAVDKLFVGVQAVVVILSGDEDVCLRAPFRQNDGDATAEVQSRPNVFLELGMALASYPKQTLILQIGEHRSISDLGGRHIVHFTGDSVSRNDVRLRLKHAGCDVKDGADWLRAGEEQIKRALEAPAPPSPSR